LFQINESEPKNTKFNCNILNFDDYEFSSICKLQNGELVVVDDKKHEILLFNDQFDYLKSIKVIDGLQICHPQRIFSENGNVYLVQRNNHQLFQLDLKFTKIKRLIRKNGEIYDSNNYPLDIFINSDYIYILILRGLKTCLQVFNLNGDFENEISLTKITNSSIPAIDILKNENKKLKLKIKNHIVFVMSETKIYIFDLEGILKNKIRVNNLNSFCFMNNFLITHSEDGYVRFYRTKDNLFEKYCFNRVIEEHVSSIKSKSTFIEYVNKKLMIFLTDQNSLAFVNIE